jgi:hypothetical protein
MESGEMKDFRSITERYTFVHTPPNHLDYVQFRYPPKVPFTGAPPWKCSQYYYWWEFLKRNKTYKETCHNGGGGSCEQLYIDFGDIYASPFLEWWNSHLQLFAEPALSSEDFAAALGIDVDNLAVFPNPEKSLTALFDQMRFMHQHLRHHYPGRSPLADRMPQYPIYKRAKVSCLHLTLLVYDLKELNPDASDLDIAELAGIRSSLRLDGRSLNQLPRFDFDWLNLKRDVEKYQKSAVQRLTRMANQYVENVGLGIFPKSDVR